VLLEVCDSLDNRFAAAPSSAGAAFHFLKSNACAAIALQQQRASLEYSRHVTYAADTPAPPTPLQARTSAGTFPPLFLRLKNSIIC